MDFIRPYQLFKGVNRNTKNIQIRWFIVVHHAATESSDCLNRLCIQTFTTCTEHAYAVCTSEIRSESNLWTNEEQTLGRSQVLNQSIHAHVDAIFHQTIKLKLQLNFDSQISFGLDTNRSVFYGPAIVAVAVLYIPFPFSFRVRRPRRLRSIPYFMRSAAIALPWYDIY